MSIEARFWNFKKKVDSTARPTTAGQRFDIVLKEPTTITAPVIELTHIARNMNYCYIPYFDRYYFVQSTVLLTNDVVQFNLSEDVLATWKNEILNSRLYVLRSASDYNVKLVDDTWTHTTDFTEDVRTVSFPSYDATGCYVITVVNPEAAASANPASTMYVLNETGLSTLLSEMFDLDNYNNIDDLTATYFNPAQYITSCRWYPFSFATISTEQGTPLEVVKYGWYPAQSATLTAVGYRVVKYGKTLTFSVQMGGYSNWTHRDANWTRYALYVPGFGVTEIDPQYSGQTLSGKISIDYNTGDANLMLTTGSNQIVMQLAGKIGSEVSINQVGGSINIPTSKEGLVNTAIQFGGAFVSKAGASNIGKTAVSMLALGSPAAALSPGLRSQAREQFLDSGADVAKAAADAAKQTILNPTVTSKGADGCRYTIIDNHTIILYRRQYTHYNPAVAQLGGVCNQVKRLGDLSGYTQVANGLIDMTGSVEERNAICGLLEGGFVIA